MMERVKLQVSALKPAARLDVLGPPPILPGEDAAVYDELLLRDSTAVKPADFLEEIWVRDIVDLDWENLRLRRCKTNLMTAGMVSAACAVLRPMVDADRNLQTLVSQWVRRDPDAVREVNRLLAKADLTTDAICARMLSENIDQLERIDRMIAMTEARRNAALREIDRHRAARHGLRRTVQQVEAAELRVIEANPAKGKPAA